MKSFKKLLMLPVIAMLLVCLGVGSLPNVHAAANRDFSELERQIGIANGLAYYDYTEESWDVLRSKVEAGNKRLADAKDQSELDAAAEDIKLAIENLVKMDYSSLINVLDEVYAKMDEDPEFHDAWYRLDKAVDKARPLLVSGDQEAVNEMAVQLKTILTELAAFDNAAGEPGVIIQEVEVEVPPTSDFCNIPGHRTWPMLFVGSAAVNVLLAAALFLVLRKKRNTTDNTPLVEYDLEDDINFTDI